MATHIHQVEAFAQSLSGSSSKPRRGSLPPSPKLAMSSALPFRDDTGLPPVAKARRTEEGRAIRLDELSGKRARKRWTAEETQMLVDGCNEVLWLRARLVRGLMTTSMAWGTGRRFSTTPDLLSRLAEHLWTSRIGMSKCNNDVSLRQC